MAGMPGGIGNTGFECGGITSPLVILGLSHSQREMHAGLPRIFDLGYALSKGLTCGAYTAGVMVFGMKIVEIENSYLRVTRMLALMVSGGNAFTDGVNKFNRPLSTRMASYTWFMSFLGGFP
jgi:hypothetical protein